MRVQNHDRLHYAFSKPSITSL